MPNYDLVDLDWTWDGDYAVGDDGDVKDTSYDYLQSLQNEIGTVVKSELLDWEKDPTIGANLSDFNGEPNTRLLGEAIERRVENALTDIGVVNGGDLSVRVIPVGPHKVMIAVNVVAFASTRNRLTVSEPVSVNLVFDTSENGMVFLGEMRPKANKLYT